MRIPAGMSKYYSCCIYGRCNIRRIEYGRISAQHGARGQETKDPQNPRHPIQHKYEHISQGIGPGIQLFSSGGWGNGPILGIITHLEFPPFAVMSLNRDVGFDLPKPVKVELPHERAKLVVCGWRGTGQKRGRESSERAIRVCEDSSRS